MDIVIFFGAVVGIILSGVIFVFVHVVFCQKSADVKIIEHLSASKDEPGSHRRIVLMIEGKEVVVATPHTCGTDGSDLRIVYVRWSFFGPEPVQFFDEHDSSWTLF